VKNPIGKIMGFIYIVSESYEAMRISVTQTFLLSALFASEFLLKQISTFVEVTVKSFGIFRSNTV